MGSGVGLGVVGFEVGTFVLGTLVGATVVGETDGSHVGLIVVEVVGRPPVSPPAKASSRLVRLLWLWLYLETKKQGSSVSFAKTDDVLKSKKEAL